MHTEEEVNSAIEKYSDMVLRLCMVNLKNSADAEDIFQTVFLKYLTAEPQFESAEHEKAWIIRTAINACKDHLKSSFFRKTVPLEEADAVAAPPVPDTEILDALKKLPENYRISLYLFYYEDYSAADIATMLGKPRAAVEQYLSRGRRKLRAHLTEERSLEPK